MAPFFSGMHGLQRCFSNSSRSKMLCNGLDIAENEAYNRYFTFQTIIDIAGAHSTISDAVCVGSPVIIIIFTKKVNKQVHRKIRNFQLE